jgi:hypothetical protein
MYVPRSIAACSDAAPGHRASGAVQNSGRLDFADVHSYGTLRLCRVPYRVFRAA